MKPFRAHLRDKETDTAFTEIAANAVKAAIEIGWHVPDVEQAQRMEVVLAAARSRLVLLQERAQGPPADTTASLLAQLSELALMRAPVDQPAAAVSDEVMSPGWHFGFRRALAIVLLTVIVGLVFASVRDHRLLYLVLISLGGLWLMGPWQLSDWVAALARHGSKGTNWVRNALQASCLCYAVYRREQRLVKAVRREELARQWVADRLSVIRGEMEVQRNRAAIASRLLTDHQQTLQQKREEVFNAD